MMEKRIHKFKLYLIDYNLKQTDDIELVANLTSAKFELMKRMNRPKNSLFR